MKIKFHHSLIPVIAFSLMFMMACQHNPAKAREAPDTKRQSLKENIGEKFEVSNLLDSAGQSVKLDFSASTINVIDFWFSDCSPCIEEMRQFEKMLPGKDTTVKVISISINRFSLWKTILTQHTGRFNFFAASLPNWQHYNLQSMENEKLNNDIPIDNINELIKKFNVSFFPAYFVVNKEGIIISRPESAVAYIKQL